MKTWAVLKSLSSGKLTSSSAMWIFIVPAIAKLSNSFELYKVDGIPFKIIAPHSLVFLYFSAISFFLASLVYFSRCPQLVKQTSSFSDFEKKGMSCYNLSESLSLLDNSKATEITDRLKKEVGTATPSEIDTDRAALISAGKITQSHSFNKELIPQSYWVVYSFHLEQRKISQFISCLLYLVGFSLLGFILLNNLYIVINHVISTW